jgi:hypothetical protein
MGLLRKAAARCRKRPKTGRRCAWRCASGRTRCAAISTNWRANSDASMCRDDRGKGVAEALLKLMPPMVIADLGAGEGTISQLMAQRAKKGDRHRQFREDGGVRRGAGAQARHRKYGIPAGRPGRRAHPRAHGGPGVSEPGAAPRTPSAARGGGSAADSEARRTDRGAGFGPASLRRSARDVCRRVAGIHGTGDWSGT